MKVLIQGAEIIDQNSPHHKKVRNVLMHNGKIASIREKNFTADKVVPAEGMKLTPGWFDLGTFAGDPGLEYKEDLESVAKAAATGGFTGLAMQPNTRPAVQTK